MRIYEIIVKITVSVDEEVYGSADESDISAQVEVSLSADPFPVGFDVEDVLVEKTKEMK